MKSFESKVNVIVKRAMRMVWEECNLPNVQMKQWAIDHPRETFKAVSDVIGRLNKLKEDWQNGKIDGIICYTLCEIISYSIKEILSWFRIDVEISKYEPIMFTVGGKEYISFNQVLEGWNYE